VSPLASPDASTEAANAMMAQSLSALSEKVKDD
jgi:hypothetical protein